MSIFSSLGTSIAVLGAALAAIRYADGTLSGTMTLRPLPATVFGFDKEASVFSGVVTSAADNAVVEGAEVKLVSDNVEYSGTTDAEGKFNFIVVQDGLEYNLTVSKEGFFADREKVNMGGTSFVKNVALNVAQGFNVLSADIPENAEVNSVYKVVARVENGEAKEAGSYRAELWMNDGIVATAETPALEASKEYGVIIGDKDLGVSKTDVGGKLTIDAELDKDKMTQVVIKAQ